MSTTTTTKDGLIATRKPARNVTNESGIRYIKKDCGWYVTENGEKRNASAAEARYLNAAYGRVASYGGPAHPSYRPI